MEKPVIAGIKPIVVELEEGKNYAYCRCGRSQNQPFCDGSHKITSFEPLLFSVDKKIRKSLCTCKQTATPPYCDSSHRELSEEDIGTQK